MTDTRPRVRYLLPDGTPVRIIIDHGDRVPKSVTFALKGGQVVIATHACDTYKIGESYE